MVVPAQDYNQIIALFNKYSEHKKTRVMTHVGFWKFLLTDQSLPAWLVKQLKRQTKLDPNLAFHIDTVIEDHILTGSLTGVLKESSCKLILKNKFGWEENPVKLDADTTVTTRQVTYRQATQEDVAKLNPPQE